MNTLLAATVSGVLKNEKSEPMANQLIYLSSGQSGTTLADGSFQFRNLLPGEYQLNTEIGAQLVPLHSFSIKESGEELNLGEVIVSKTIQLKDVVVQSNQVNRHIERMPDIKGNIIYAGKKNEVVRLSTAVANLAQNNSRQIFCKVPGVQVWESDGSGVQMGIATRGLSPNRMWEFNTRQNGYDIASDPFGYPEAYYTPSVESLDRIEIIRGAASLQYGPQFGGVVNYVKKQSISGKKVGVESMQTLGSYGMFSTFNAVGGTLGNFSYYTNINYRRSNGWRTNNQYETWNGYVNLGYQINKNMKASVEYTRMDQMVQQPGGLTDSMFNADAQQSIRGRNWFKLVWNIGAVNFDYQINTNNKLNIKVFGLSGDRSSIGNLSVINQPDTLAMRRIDIDNYRNWGVEVRHLYTYKFLKKQSVLSAGIRYYSGSTSRIRNNSGSTGTAFSTDELSATRAVDLKFNTRNLAVFAENLFNLSNRLSITPGFRYEILANSSEGKYTATATLPKSESNRSFMLMGVGAQYKTSSHTNVYANYTQCYRPVLFSDITPAATTDSIDKNLADARGYNIDLGYRGSFSKLLSFDVSLYYMAYENRIGSYLVNGKNYKTNIGASVSKGLESYIEFSPSYLFAKQPYGNISVFASLAFINATYTSWNNPDPTKSQKDKKVENAPETIQRYGLTYSIKTFSTTFQISHVGACYADAMNIENPTANAQSGLIPAYKVCDWSVAYRFKNHYNLNGGVNNVFDAKYFTRRGGGYPGPGLLPAEGRMWYLGVGVKF